MRFIRIKAILLQEYFLTLRSVEMMMDILFFPTMSIIVFGFLSLYLAGTSNQAVGNNVLVGMLLWQIIFIVQYSVSIGSLWNIWSRNLSNLFVTPLLVVEYLCAQTLSGVLKALIILVISAFISIGVFHFNLYSLGMVNLLLFFTNLLMFSFALGLAILGLIFRYGTRIQSFAWGLLPLFQPLTAAFYPVSILPAPIQVIAYLLSPTYIFEAARYTLATQGIAWRFIGIAYLENSIYCLLALWFFSTMFRNSKNTGQFARNES